MPRLLVYSLGLLLVICGPGVSHAQPTAAPPTQTPLLQPDGRIMLLARCPNPDAALSLLIDNGLPRPLARDGSVDLPLDLTLVADLRPAVDSPGTPLRTARRDQLALIRALVEQVPADTTVTLVAQSSAGLRPMVPAGPPGLVLTALSALEHPAHSIPAHASAPLTATARLAAQVVFAAAPHMAVEPVAGPRLLIGLGSADATGDWLQQEAATLNAAALRYYTAVPAELPTLMQTVLARYDDLLAARQFQRLVAPGPRPAPGLHRLTLRGCGDDQQFDLDVPVDQRIWLWLGSGALGLVIGAVWLVRHRQGGRTKARPLVGQTSTARFHARLDAPTERGERSVVAPALGTLVVAQGGREHTYPLVGRQWTIGRDSACDIVVDNSWISALHARLSLAGDSFELYDLGSTNGTSIGAERRPLEPHRPEPIGRGEIGWLGPEVWLRIDTPSAE